MDFFLQPGNHRVKAGFMVNARVNIIAIPPLITMAFDLIFSSTISPISAATTLDRCIIRSVIHFLIEAMAVRRRCAVDMDLLRVFPKEETTRFLITFKYN